MAYRVGVDLGTSSVALVAVGLNDEEEPESIIYHAVRIFPEPVLPDKGHGVGELKNAHRRTARLMRRQVERRARRLRKIAALCTVLELDPATVPPDRGQTIHRRRAEAATQPIPLPDLMRVFLKIAKRRGYAGGFRVRPKDSEVGQVQEGISRLKEEMEKAGCHTLGEYLFHRYCKHQSLKLKEEGLYADREMVEAEFEKIWETQAKAHPILNKSYAGRSIKQLFHDAIFYQRPLKSVAAMVGHCRLEPSLPRAPWAQPAAQAFRIEKQLVDLRWGTGRNARPLSNEQKAIIRTLLEEKSKVSFDTIYKELKRKGLMDTTGQTLNFDRPARPELVGNKTNAAFAKLGLLNEWRELAPDVQVSVINFLADLGSPQELDRPDWHLRFCRRDGQPRRFKQEMVDFINKMIETQKFDRLTKMGFDGGRAAYSLKALKRLTERMTEGLDESQAIDEAYPQLHQQASAMQLERLRPHPPTGNVVVDVALRQFRYQFNMMIDTIGEPPSQVIVELAREIKLGITRRKELEKKNAMNMKNKQAARKELESQGIVPTDRHVERYLRWKEQETCCPYCERKISFDEAMNGNATNLDHIIPRSLTRVGRQSKHLLLVHRSCNDEKGDRTPYQQWGQDPDRWKVIEDHAELLRRKRLYEKARLLTLKDFEMDVVDDAAINDFSERQFHETSWIAKLVTQWVRTVCPNVSPSRGAFTAYLRRHWKLETVIPQVRIEENLPLFSLEARDSNTSEAPENRVITPEEFERLRPIWEGHQPADDTTTPRHFDKRIDHRHHFIDALVITMTSRSLYQKMARAWKESYERRQRPSFAVPPPIENLRKQALEIVRQCNLTHKPDRYPSGALFKDTAYGVTQSDPRHPDSQVDRLVLREDVKELTRKDCENIVHPSTRDYLLKHFSGQQSPSGPLEHPNFHTPIKKVRVAQPLSASGPMVRRIEHRPKSAGRSVTLYKYLAGKEYAYVEVGYDEKRKVNVRLVTLFEADRSKHVDHHNETRRFYKGDTVIFKSRRFLIKKICALSNGANAQLFLVPITETRTADDIARLQGKLNPRPSDLLRVSGKALLQLQRV